MIENYNIMLLILVFVVIIFFTFTLNKKRRFKDTSNYKKIDLATFKNLIEHKKDLVILDVSNKEDFKLNNIENSVNVESYVIKKTIETIISDKNTPIVVYSSNGRSRSTSLTLLFIGYNEVYDFGNIDNWVENN